MKDPLWPLLSPKLPSAQVISKAVWGGAHSHPELGAWDVNLFTLSHGEWVFSEEANMYYTSTVWPGAVLNSFYEYRALGKYLNCLDVLK